MKNSQPIVTPLQMQEIDRRAIEDLGIPSLVLMENAGMCVVEEIERRAGTTPVRVTSVCGPGNNGGDGIVAARLLHEKGYEAVIFLASPRKLLSKDARIQLKTASDVGVPIQLLPKGGGLEKLRARLAESDFVLDALFGTGMTREVTGICRDLVEAINESPGTVVSVDIPSGLDGLSGHPAGCAVLADVTVTFAFPKLGFAVFPGAAHAGEVVVGDIGIPAAACDGLSLEGFFTDPSHVCKAFGPRWPDTHKGSYGHLLVVSGSTGRVGAGLLTSEGALRSGAGLVTLALPASSVTAADAAAVEVMTEPLPETQAGTLAGSGLQAVKKLILERSALAIGPGLSVNDETVALVRDILELPGFPAVVDADALNAVAADLDLINARGAYTVLTPHPGEMGRLLGSSAGYVQADRVGAARECAGRTDAVVVLKGARTVIAEPGGRYYVNLTGNPGMSTAGSGDVLTGMIGALLARGLDPILSSVASVYLHGAAGDFAAEMYTEHSMTAGDLLTEIGPALKAILTETIC